MAKKELSMDDMFRKVSEDMRRAALAPNVFNYVPHEKQVDFHSSDRNGRLYIGGNRSGKTTGGVIEDIWWLTGKHPYLKTPPPPVRGRVVGVDFVNGISKILLPQFAQWLPLSDLKGGSWDKAYSKELKTLTLANDSFVEFMSYDQDLDKFAGTSRHFIHFDEECPQDIYIENKMRLIDVGGRYWVTMTPVDGMTWIYDDIYLPGIEGRDPNTHVTVVDMMDNPHLNVAEIDMQLSGLSKDEKKARKEGKFVQIGGLVYKSFDPDIHVVDSFVPPLDWEWYASVDHGYNNPTAWLWHAVSPEGDVVTFAEHFEAEKTIEYHAMAIHTRNAAFGRSPDMYVGDPAMSQRNAVTGTSIFDEYAKLEIPITPGNNDVASGVAIVQHYLDTSNGRTPKWTITENCQNLIREMKRLRWKTWANKRIANQNNKYDVIHKKDDHACDSARYFFTCMPDLVGAGIAVTPDRVRPFPLIGEGSNQSVDHDWQLSSRFRAEAYDDSVGIY